MMSDLSFILRALDKATSFDDALEVVRHNLKSLGFNHYIFSLMDVNASPVTFRMTYFDSNYPEEWQKEYFENNYIFQDPVAMKIMANEEPFFWHSIINQENYDHNTVIEHARPYDIVDGVGCSFLKTGGQLYALTFASSQELNDNYEQLADMYLLASRIVTAYERCYEQNAETITVSSQEERILSLATIGKTDAEIATLMGLSVNTIRYHWKNIFKKLNSYSRIFAIVKAMNAGLININQFERTTEDGSVQKYKKIV